MALWKIEVDKDMLNNGVKGTIHEQLGIEFTEVGDDYIKAQMPVNARTVQPAGILHGGASVVLAESLGSTTANLCVDQQKQHCVGLDINANHLRAVSKGNVEGIAKPIHIGKSTQVWEMKIYDMEQHLINISRLTMVVLNK